jgi:hypothetical protein
VGARGITQAGQYAMAELWNIPGTERPSFCARQARGLALLLVFALGVVATTLLTGLGSVGGRSAAFRLASLAAGGYLVGHNLRHATEVYGFFAVVIGLLSWLYLGSELTLYAAEVNVVLTRRLWPRSLLPPPLTGPDERALVALATQEERRPEESVQVSFTGQGDDARSDRSRDAGRSDG